MDLIAIILGFGSLAIFIIPITYIHWIQRIKKKRLLEKFLALAEQERLNIDKTDLWSTCYCIGIDTVANKLFYLKSSAIDEQKIFINLAEVEKCRVVNITRTVNQSSGDIKVTDRIDLLFTFNYPKSFQRTIEFYSVEESLDLRDEFPLADKWANLINSNVKAKKPAVPVVKRSLRA